MLPILFLYGVSDYVRLISDLLVCQYGVNIGIYFLKSSFLKKRCIIKFIEVCTKATVMLA